MIVTSGDEYGHQIGKAAGAFFNPVCDRVIARVENDNLLGGVIYTGFTGASIGVHFAGFTPRWINRELIFKGFDYPFNQLGCGRLIAQVPETSVKALELVLSFGFKVVAKVEHVFSDGACIVLAMPREDCRWLGPKICGGKPAE